MSDEANSDEITSPEDAEKVEIGIRDREDAAYWKGLEEGRPRWISVSDRLPNYGEHVFALWPTDDPDEPVAVAARYHATDGSTPLFETWDERITDESFTQPTHWIPEPPKP